MVDEKIKQARDYFYQKKYTNAFDIYSQFENSFFESGLCALLLKDEKTAFKYWSKHKNKCPGCAFGLCVLDYINLKNNNAPTFFQTRAHLEVFLNLFLENGLIEWAENLIGYSDVLYKANPETYKFIARALFSNGYFDLAIIFCKKTLKLYYCDPEAFLIMAQCEFLLGNLADSLDSINRVNSMVSDYFPAKVFRQVILEEMKRT